VPISCGCFSLFCVSGSVFIRVFQFSSRSRRLTSDWDPSWGLSQIIRATGTASVLLTEIGDRLPKLGAWGQGCVTLIGDAAHPMSKPHHNVVVCRTRIKHGLIRGLD